MTTTPPEADERPEAEHGPRASRDELRELGRIRRTTGPDRKVAGVAGGLARHLDIDPVILRVAFVVLVFFGGAGLIAYAGCWLLVPEDGSARRPLGLDDRNRSFALIGVAVLAGLSLLGDTFGSDFFPWPVAISIGLLVLLAVGALDRDRHVTPTAPPVPHHLDPGSGQFVPAPPGTRVAAPPAYHPRPRNPRRRGPILFWFTLALAALGIGVLGILDVAGTPVAASAYPAVVVGACGVMLLVGAFYGRAGGLTLVGLLASLALLGATAAQHIEGGDITRTPLTAAEVPTELHSSAGEVVLDLREVQDLEALDGRRVEVSITVGRIEVILPPGVSARIDAQVNGGGHIDLFGSDHGGFGVSSSLRHSGGVDTPEISIGVDATFGEIQIHERPAS